MTAFSPERAAAALLGARRTGRPISAAEPAPGSQDEAFAVQALVARETGPAGAWKVGGGGTAAPIATHLVRRAPAHWSARDFFRIGIEAEIAFLLGQDVPTGRALSREELRESVASVHAAIEIVDSRLDVWPVPDPLWALADNQNNGGLVYGPEGRPLGDEDLSRATLRVTADGRTLFEGEGANPGGDPLALLASLAAHLASRGGLRAGTLVTTGSLSGIAFVGPGAAVRAEIMGFAPVEVSFPA